MRPIAWPKRLRLALFVIYVAILVAIVSAFIAREEHNLRSGREIVLQSQPVDPVDLIRGQYVVLSYVAQTVPSWCYDGDGDGLVYVTLTKSGRYWAPTDCDDRLESRSSLGDESVQMKARVSGAGGRRVEYPDIERYYVPDGTAAPPRPPDVVLSVKGDGTARIKRLEIDGVRWP